MKNFSPPVFFWYSKNYLDRPDSLLSPSCSLPQNTCAIHVPPQEARQAKMNKVDGSILSRLYRNHIQDYGSPGPFWEQELESLHHVIEMKNERIHELEKQLFLLEMLKEKNLILALKNTTLQQEVEDLQFQARNRLAMSR